GYQQNYFLTLNGGTERAKALASVGYFKQDGLITNTDYERYTLRLNTDMKLTDKFAMKFDVFLRQLGTDEPSASLYNVISWANRIPATQPNVFTNGNRGIGWEGNNPAAMAEESGLNRTVTRSALPTLNFTYQVVDGLEAEVN